ncbi:MAG TPA: tetratricopeptide repeat protein [Alphaproteobacteria bacterium]|nr:tetratricopeptide repeat protein [Alphaproteobacteria bacterium]
MNALRFLVFGISAMAALSLMVMAALAADRVTIAAGHHPGFGRIAFRWPSPVGFTVARDGDAVLIRFARPLEGTLDRVTGELDDYLAGAQIEEGGQVVRLALKRPYELRSFKDGAATVVVDLLGAPDKVAKDVEASAKRPERSAQVETAQAVAETAPLVRVRKGEHKGFDRLVFDWSKPVEYRVAQDGARVTISFDRAARMELAALRRHPPRYAADITAEQTATGTVVSLRLAAGAHLRDFRDGRRIGLDILAPSLSAKTAEAAPKAPTPSEQAPQSAAAAAKREPVLVRVGPVAAGAPAPLTTAAPAPVAAAAKPADGALAVGYVANDKATTLRFPWADKTALAAFRQNDSLWLVFDRPGKLDLAQVPSAGDGRNFDRVETVANARATVLRLRLAQGTSARTREEGAAWIVELSKGDDRPAVPLTLSAEPHSPIGPRVTFNIDHPGNPLEITDPESGAKLIVVPVSQAGLGIFGERAYVEFRLLASMQGIAVEPLVPGIYVTARLDGVDIRDGKGLILSTLPAALTEGNVFGNAETIPALFDFAAWRGDPKETPLARKQALEQRLAQAGPGQRDKARLDFARFYFAEGMAPEAQSFVSLIAKANPSILGTVEERTLQGALAVLDRDFAAAGKFLDDKSLDAVPEAVLWRGAAAAEQGDYSKAEADFIFGGGLIGHYPPPIALHLELLAADTLLANGDKERAQALIEGLAKRDVTGAEAGRLAYLQGRLRELQGRNDDALALYDKATAGADPAGAVKAALARIALLSKLGRIDRKEAISRLDSLRYDWRGDAVELELLERLGRLYLASGDYRDGLITLRRAVSYFPNSPRAKPLAALMSQAFADLFVKGDAAKLPPAQAVALYDEFKELAPTGAAGDTAALHLADRLVAADLLDRAASVLDNLIKTRLTGDDKARAGARLAEVRLLDRRPDLALDALAATEGDALPDDLVATRRRLQARALAAQDKSDEALAALGDDGSPAADAIRSDILWQAQNWTAAAQLYERMTKDLPRGKTPLAPGEAKTVLRWAAALTMLGDRSGIDGLRARFTEAMPAGETKDAFAALTSTTGEPGDSFRKLAATVADLGRLKALMSDYSKGLAPRAAAAPTAKAAPVATD